jgi:hypothetical protein
MRENNEIVNIMRFIPLGKKRAVSREKLVELTGLDDRTVRNLIAQERKSNIILAKRSGGYYMPTIAEIDEIKEYIKIEESRAKSIFSNIKMAREFVKAFSKE